MKENILEIIIQAECEFSIQMGSAKEKAQQYAYNRKADQKANIEQLKNEWNLFEEEENRKLKDILLKEENELEEKVIKSKELLKTYKEQKAEIISERLKREVLSLDGYS